MLYHVYRQGPNGAFEEIAITKLIQDANRVYDNWHSAKILHNGKVIAEKNISK